MTNALLSSEQLLTQLHWRYATKKFDSSKKIPDEVWQALEDCLVLTPSSFGVQPWKFFVVKDPEIRQQLLAHSWKQAQVVDASHLVVFAIKKDINESDVNRLIEATAAIRQVPVDSLQGFSNVVKGFLVQPPYPLDLNEWSIRQVYIALGQFMTSAAFLGIDTCPMEGFSPSQYDEILGLSATEYRSVVVCPAGYRAQDDKYATLPKVRYAKEEVIAYI